jgi:hypothetical protein
MTLSLKKIDAVFIRRLKSVAAVRGITLKELIVSTLERTFPNKPAKQS